MLRKIFTKIDKTICKYLGLQDYEMECPRTIKIKNNNIIIYKNIPYLRHRLHESFKEFNENSLAKTDLINRQKIGIAAGKVVAKNLVISFEKITVKNDNT